MRLMIVFALLASCTPNSSYKETTNNIVDDKNISFNEFKINIINYAKKSKYPNIND
tara:strand:- start:21 stop:188 length:168 start_codon:yes stop_codon:yes gene_type:complete